MITAASIFQHQQEAYNALCDVLSAEFRAYRDVTAARSAFEKREAFVIRNTDPKVLGSNPEQRKATLAVECAEEQKLVDETSAIHAELKVNAELARLEVERWKQAAALVICAGGSFMEGANQFQQPLEPFWLKGIGAYQGGQVTNDSVEFRVGKPGTGIQVTPCEGFEPINPSTISSIPLEITPRPEDPGYLDMHSDSDGSIEVPGVHVPPVPDEDADYEALFAE